MEGRILKITDEFPFADVRINKLSTVIIMRNRKSDIKVTISFKGVSFDKPCFIDKKLLNAFNEISHEY